MRITSYCAGTVRYRVNATLTPFCAVGVGLEEAGVSLRAPKLTFNRTSLRPVRLPTFLRALSPVTGGTQQPKVGESVIVTWDNVVYVGAGCSALLTQTAVALDDLLPEMGPLFREPGAPVAVLPAGCWHLPSFPRLPARALNRARGRGTPLPRAQPGRCFILPQQAPKVAKLSTQRISARAVLDLNLLGQEVVLGPVVRQSLSRNPRGIGIDCQA